VTADGAMPEPMNEAVSRTAMTNAEASAHAVDTPTPFYDRLMSMIDATAVENERGAQDDDVYVASHVARWWRVRLLGPGIAGLVAVAAIGGILLVSAVNQRQPPAETANADPSLDERPRVADNASATQAPAERPVPAAVPDGLGPVGVEAVGPAEDGNRAAAAVAANSDGRPLATSVAGQAIENLGPGVEARGDGPAVAQDPPTQAVPIDPIASATDPANEQPPQADLPSSWPSTIEAGPAERADSPSATHTARVVSGVRLRAGPSNGEAVLATISGGRSVEVIKCRAWCEVIFAGQRGWVYKDFIAPIPGGG
jgi:SH3 domain-containing protein